MYINDVSKKLNISKKAINLYEEKGLIQPKKDKNGYRVYDDCEHQLLVIQQLRKFDFSIAEIKEILIYHNDEVFSQKKKDYQKQIYRIDTSLQYLDQLKENIVEGKNLENISKEINEILNLENDTVEDNLSIDLDKLYFNMMTISAVLAFWSYKNIFIEILAIILFLSTALLNISPRIRVYLYQFYKKFLK